MKRSYPVLLVVFLGLWTAAILMAGGRITVFVSVPALAVVVAVSLVMLLGSFSFREIGRCFAVAYGDSPESRDDLEVALAFFEAAERYLIVSGVLGFFVGAVTMLANLTDASTMGSGTALALLTVVYGLMLYIGLVVPFKAAVKRKLAAA